MIGHETMSCFEGRRSNTQRNGYCKKLMEVALPGEDSSRMLWVLVHVYNLLC